MTCLSRSRGANSATLFVDHRLGSAALARIGNRRHPDVRGDLP